MTEFEAEVQDRLKQVANNHGLARAAESFILSSIESQYSYNWFWLGRPVIQYPQDICAMQELVFSIKPDVIVETGIAHGGSLILSRLLVARFVRSHNLGRITRSCQAKAEGDWCRY